MTSRKPFVYRLFGTFGTKAVTLKARSERAPASLEATFIPLN